MAGKSCLTLHWSQLRVLRSCWISKEEVTRDILTFMVLRTLLFQIYNYSTDANLHYVQLGFQREKSLKADLTLSARLVVERRGEGRGVVEWNSTISLLLSLCLQILFSCTQVITSVKSGHCTDH